MDYVTNETDSKARGRAPGPNPLRYLPAVRQWLWRWTYYAYARASTEELTFMNFGYAEAADERATAPRTSEFYSQRLYAHVVDDVNLRGKDVLEVGCGRGGGSAYLKANFDPKSMVGMDLVPVNIERSRARHQLPGLSFQVGDAMALPFEAAQFDAVVNIESSHCYPSRARFFDEVFRVLRPGGHFLFADLVFPFYDGQRHADVTKLLGASGLTVLKQEDITTDVLRARRLVSAEGDESLKRTVPILRLLPASFRRESSHLKGSTTYNALLDGTASYWCWLLTKS